MTALIYKAALPTYTSLEDLNANAGESLLLNQAGTAYELEPAQGGASVASTDSLGANGQVPLTAGNDTYVSWSDFSTVGDALALDPEDSTAINCAAGLYILMFRASGAALYVPDGLTFNVEASDQLLPSWTSPFELAPVVGSGGSARNFLANGVLVEGADDFTLKVVLRALGNPDVWTASCNFDLRRLQ